MFATEIDGAYVMNSCGACLGVLLLTLLGGCQQERNDPPMPLPAVDLSFELVDESGDAVTADDYSGTLRLVFFGYTSCPDICPLTLQNIAIALDSLKSLARQVTVLFISVDPKRDTPERLARYTDAFHSSIVGLTGTHEQITAVTNGFRTTFGYSLYDVDGQTRPLERDEYNLLAPTAAYTPYHGSQVYVIGHNDELLDIIGYGSKPKQIEVILRKHL
ncbi:MAG: SCO family protein [Gammaproteobacteria bacterium]|nr:SCO family protein [Gammaproteobacteria bacterium]